MAGWELSREEAQRVAIAAQWLDAPADSTTPRSLIDVVSHLTFLQHDLTAAVAPSADLVAWSRLGPSYESEDLRVALDQRLLVEFRTLIRPAEDIALYRADMAEWPGPGPLVTWQEDARDWVAANDQGRRDILAELEASGPSPAGALPDTCAVPWRSSGWSNQRNVTRLLEFMEARGEVAVARRQGRERLWDLAERVFPADAAVPREDALRTRNELLLRSLGLARATLFATEVGVELPGESARVEGVRGTWRLDPTYLDRPFSGRVALLSPLDRLVFDRARMTELLGFDYQLEMYKPAAQRRWGYFALPILVDDRLIGKLDAAADRAAGVLRVHAVHEDVPFDGDTTERVWREIEGLAEWLRLELRVER